ncbi:hypothetical protein DsansV1_C19g0157301 [Dioscorea sansibarensis]
MSTAHVSLSFLRGRAGRQGDPGSTRLMVQRKQVYDLRHLILTGDSESCCEHIFQLVFYYISDD